MLDAGTWFNETKYRTGPPSFASQHQYISLEDLMWLIPKGKCWNRIRRGLRSVHSGTEDRREDQEFKRTADVIKYTFGCE